LTQENKTLVKLKKHTAEFVLTPAKGKNPQVFFSGIFLFVSANIVAMVIP
jgi:hypothetical protein